MKAAGVGKDLGIGLGLFTRHNIQLLRLGLGLDKLHLDKLGVDKLYPRLAGRLFERGHTLARQSIGAFVFFMTGMALDPAPFNLMALARLI